jgi:accessory gene regulator protein AgrB
MSIFDYIEYYSYKIADRIGKGDSEEDIELYRYSVFMITSNAFTSIFGLILSAIFGYMDIYLICLITYALLRTVAGGQHCDTFRSCFYVSNIIMVLCCILAKVTESIPELMCLLAIVIGANTIPTCPKPSTNSPSRGYFEDTRFRKKLAMRFSILIVIDVVLILLGYSLFSTSISAGILVLCFVLTDFGENLISRIFD